MKLNDRTALKTLRTEMDAALAEIGLRHGIQLKTGRCGFDASGDVATFKVEAGRIGDNGVVETKEAAAFRQLAQLYGLEPTDLGKTFRSGGRTYTVEGLRTRARAKPILARGDNGKAYIFQAEIVAAMLKVA